MDPQTSTTEADALVEQKTAPRVTVDSIKARIRGVEYIENGVLIICIITMANGFMVFGKSAPASPENFDRAIGERYAFDDAFKQLWAFEGYLLREQLQNARA